MTPHPKPTPEEQLLENVKVEVQRVEEDCTHSSKSHFNAADRWGRYNLWLGIPSIVLSAAASAAFLGEYPEVAGAMTSVAAILTSLITFLKPSERGAAHKSAGDQYLALRNDARVFREIEINHAGDMHAAISFMGTLTKRRNELNQSSPQFSDKDRREARRGIEEGEATHVVDREKP